MIHLPDKTLPSTQVIVMGRLREEITDRGLEGFSASLSFAHAGLPSLPLPARLNLGREGYFAFHMVPAQEMPPFPSDATVTLVVDFEPAGHAAVSVSQEIAGADLALVDRPVSVDDQGLSVRVIAGAPFDFSASIPPEPVALQGTVLRDFDPTTPAENVIIRADAEPAVTTDAAGRFFIPRLPITAAATLTLTDQGAATTETYRPDFSQPVNKVTLSLESSSP